MSDRVSIRGIDPEGVADGDYVVSVAAGVVTGLTAAPAAGGGGSVAIDDEGVETVAAASRLNFTGPGVTATDAGSGEVTVTIPGGGGGGTSTTVDTPPTTPNAKDDEFTDLTGQSGPVNGLAAKWSKRNLATAVQLEKNSRMLGLAIPGGQGQDQALYQTAPAGDFRIAAALGVHQQFTRMMFGLLIVDASGNGVSMEFDNGDSGSPASACIRNVTAWAQTGTNTQIAGAVAGGAFSAGDKVYASLRKSGSTYYGAAWTDPSILVSAAVETAHTPSAFTPAYVGFGQIYHGSASPVRGYIVDWFRVT